MVPVIVPPEIVPVFVIVPELVIDPADVNVTPDAIATVSPLSPSVTVPQFAVGVILLTLTSLINPIDIYTLLLLYQIRLHHQHLYLELLHYHLHRRQC